MTHTQLCPTTETLVLTAAYPIRDSVCDSKTMILQPLSCCLPLDDNYTNECCTAFSYVIAAQSFMGFPSGSEGKEFDCSVVDLGSIPGSGRSPAAGNATHSRILAWEIPWTEMPGGLQSKGLHRVRHN